MSPFHTSQMEARPMVACEPNAKTPVSEAYVRMAEAAIRSAISAEARLPMSPKRVDYLFEALASLERWEAGE